MKEDESVNFEMFEQIVDFHAENGTSALLVMGSTGEPTVLELDERRAIIDRVTRMSRGKLPVFFGTTCGSTRATIALTRYAEDCGADGVVLVVPPYVTPPQDAVYEHFLKVAASVKSHVRLYNNHPLVHIKMDPPAIRPPSSESPKMLI